MAGWTCATCTFANENMEFLCCALCGAERSTSANENADAKHHKEKRKRSATESSSPRNKKGLRGAWATLLRPMPSTQRGALMLEQRSGSATATWRIGGAACSSAAGMNRVWDGRCTINMRLRPRGVVSRHEISLALDADHDRTPAWVGATRYPKGQQLLQSHLQKCIRRGLIELACRTARELASSQRGLEMLLRRLPIILVEDLTAPAAWVTLLIFYSLALAAGYCLTDIDIGIVLGIVAAAAAYPVPPCIPRTYLDEFPTQDGPLSLLARAAYGGTSGDVDMLLRAASLSSHPEQQLITPLPVASIRPIEPADWLLAGVDFHCASSIFTRMRHLDRSQTLGDVDDDQLRDWMWAHRSSINFRRPHAESNDEEPAWAPAAHGLASAAALALIKAAFAPPMNESR